MADEAYRWHAEDYPVDEWLARYRAGLTPDCAPEHVTEEGPARQVAP